MTQVSLIHPLALLLTVLLRPPALIAGPPSADPLAARVILLNGETVVGRATRMDDEGLLMTAEGDVRRIALGQLELIEFPGGGATEAPVGWLELVDGSLAPIVDWRWSDSDCQVTLPAWLSGAAESAVAPQLVRAFRYREFSADQRRQWQELIDLDAPGDLVVIERASGDLDRVEVVAVSSEPDGAHVLLDGEPIQVPRKKLAGLIFARATTAPMAEPTVVAIGPERLGLKGATVRYDALGGLSIKTCSGTRFQTTPGAITRIDFRAANVAYLSDLTPLSAERSSYFADGSEQSQLARRWGEPRWDEAFDGGPLRLRRESVDGYPAVESFAKGIAVRSRSTLRFARPDGFGAFAALVGIDPDAPALASAILTISGDGEPLMSMPLRAGEPASPLRIDVARYRRISIVIDFGENLDIGDRVVLADARFTR